MGACRVAQELPDAGSARLAPSGSWRWRPRRAHAPATSAPSSGRPHPAGRPEGSSSCGWAYEWPPRRPPGRPWQCMPPGKRATPRSRRAESGGAARQVDRQAQEVARLLWAMARPSKVIQVVLGSRCWAAAAEARDLNAQGRAGTPWTWPRRTRSSQRTTPSGPASAEEATRVTKRRRSTSG